MPDWERVGRLLGMLHKEASELSPGMSFDLSEWFVSIDNGDGDFRHFRDESPEAALEAALAALEDA